MNDIWYNRYPKFDVLHFYNNETDTKEEGKNRREYDMLMNDEAAAVSLMYFILVLSTETKQSRPKLTLISYSAN